MRTRFLFGLPAVAAALAVAAPAAAAEGGAGQAMAKMLDSKGGEVGSVTLQQMPKGVLLSLDLANLPPGVQAFHIHEVGKCEGPDFKSSGGHFNPTGASHGFASEKGPHAGDLPNIHVPESGTLRVEYYTQMVTLKEGEANSLLGGDGTSLMIHEGPDDHKTDPAGHAGGRIACGVITR